MDLREQKFGIEIEMTGITRLQAAQVLELHFNQRMKQEGGVYDKHSVKDTAGRQWTVVSDSSINAQRMTNRGRSEANADYRAEFVSPICTYDDIETIQILVRNFRAQGAFINSSCGIHIHINAEPFTAQQLRNLVNIVAAKEDMIYRALQVNSSREHYYCKKIDPHFLERLNQRKPQQRDELKSLWYNGRDGSHLHYHESRYHCLNLHSVFQKNTIEFRAFNGNLHAGKIKAYIQFCMAMTAQAYNQKFASQTKTVSTNEKYTFRVWLLRLGMIGDEFKTARTHLLGHLEGNVAWKNPEQAKAQKERLRAKREKEQAMSQPTAPEPMPEEAPEIEQELEDERPQMGMSMSM